MEQIQYSKVRAAVCAVGYADNLFSETGSIELTKDIIVLGTGFLIAENKVLTNRHVIQALKKSAKSTKHWTLIFFNSVDNSGKISINQGFAGFEFPQIVEGTDGFSTSTDIGVLVPANPFNEEFKQKRFPVEFTNLDQLEIGKDIAICGYAGGNSFISFEQLNFVRMGPITHFGKISALAPWDHLIDGRKYTNILTDISNGGGFSGSPLFCQSTGLVCGIHYAGSQDYGIGIALPLDQQRADDISLAIDCTLNGKYDLPRSSVLCDLDDKGREECNTYLASIHKKQ